MPYHVVLDRAGRFDPDRVDAWIEAQRETGLDRDVSALPFLFGYPDSRIPFPVDAFDRPLLSPELERLWRESTTAERQSQYLHLFVKGLPRPRCPPYGSAWLEGPGDTDAAERIRELYRRHGLDTTEAPDHFAVECQFLGVLRSLTRRDPDNREDYLLLLCHLMAWAGAFLDRVAAEAASPYCEAARFARGVLERLAAEAVDDGSHA